MDRFVGTTLASRYMILQKIGTGGMANVYRAQDNVLNRQVAVKILKEEYKNEKEFLDRFRTEAHAVALLSHPNIVAVYDVGTENGLPFLVMELVEGITLKQYIAQKGHLSDKEIVHFICQILKAMEHAHAKNIVHRDIKPQNIMLLHDGTIKVTDFGIARFTLSNTKTMTDTAIGSVHYISPEQAKGSVADQRTDIYSLGVMMYEMLTGALPFEGDNPVAVAVMHLRGDFKKPSELRPDVTPGLEAIALKAMCREPALRYQSAGEMLADMDQFKENPMITFHHQYQYDQDQGTMNFQVPPEEAARARREAVDSGMSRPQNRANPPAYKEEGKFTAVKITLIVICIALLLAFGFFAMTKLVGSNGTTTPSPSVSTEEQVPVPNLVGLKYDAVIDNKDAYSDFVLKRGEDKYDETVPAGYILAQSIDENSMVAPGTEIILTVSSGAETALVPELSGKDEAYVTSKLQEAGLTMNKTEAYSETIAEGMVVSTDPKAGEEVAKNSVVTVVFSKGKEPIMADVPQVVGDDSTTAQKKLKDAGLVVSVEEIDGTEPKGQVVAQSIEAETQVESGTTITISISKGPSDAEKGYVTRDYTILLPSDPEEFELTVTIAGEGDQYNKVVTASQRQITVPITGRGTKDIDVFIDGEYYEKGSTKGYVFN